jgi:hypothetical protein
MTVPCCSACFLFYVFPVHSLHKQEFHLAINDVFREAHKCQYFFTSGCLCNVHHTSSGTCGTENGVSLSCGQILGGFSRGTDYERPFGRVTECVEGPLEQ